MPARAGIRLKSFKRQSRMSPEGRERSFPMTSPLDIDRTAKQYNLDAELKEQLIACDKNIWQDCQIKTVDDLVAFEKGYKELGKNLDFCFDSEVEEFAPVYMMDGEMCLLDKGAFQRTANGKGELLPKFMSAGLSDAEAVVIITFLAEISGLYRKDAYHFGIPPFVHAVCEVLNRAVAKLPAYSETVVRACNEYDKADFNIGDVFTPAFCLTTSADLTWENTSENRYRIQPLDAEHTKARSIFSIHDISEKQVTFLDDASFRITAINEWGEGKKEFVMEEI